MVTSASLFELPIAGTSSRPQRADALRNQAAILRAARELFARHGASNVSIAAVAKAAGVSKGTIFHHFGDRSGLAFALLDEHERVLQETILSGRPPLGPGADARVRLVAFVHALIALGEEHGELLLTAESSKAGSRYRTGAYAAWHQHITVLIHALRPEVDASMHAHLLLSPLAAELHQSLRASADADGSRFRSAMRQLIVALVRPESRRHGPEAR